MGSVEHNICVMNHCHRSLEIFPADLGQFPFFCVYNIYFRQMKVELILNTVHIIKYQDGTSCHGSWWSRLKFVTDFLTSRPTRAMFMKIMFNKLVFAWKAAAATYFL
jgi:hypothetical protein